MDATEIEAMGLLQDPARRSLYEYVVVQGRAVSRNEAAQAVGVQRTLAAFHLDRLADAGLLEVEFRRTNGRSGPGAGRPSKLYRRASSEHAISLPPRDYLCAAQVFGDALDRAGAEDALYASARESGLATGRELAGSRKRVTIQDILEVLGERGYEPYDTHDGYVRLRNCPFHALAQVLPTLTCGANLSLLEGVLVGGGLAQNYRAELVPESSGCCVAISSKTNHT
ncbi:MAG: transcriptional regulator [Chloroflexi bacterium]|nr:transcriptional regulator [Chloroflexota bacterium]